MGVDVVQRLDRRGFLGAAAAMLASSSAPAIAQTFISGTPSSDVGFSRGADRPPEPITQVIQSGYSSVARAAPLPTKAIATDWRSRLLTGDRTILMRRDGPVRRIRYYTADGLLDRAGYAEACVMLRDLRAGKVFPMDPRLLDILCGLQRWGEYNGRDTTILLTSGFRSDATNQATEGAAKNSMHRYGRAADIVLEGFSSGLMGAMVRQFNHEGGTGIYLARGFAHVDTGASRSWVSTARRSSR